MQAENWLFGNNRAGDYLIPINEAKETIADT
jgi:hypothetical protein